MMRGSMPLIAMGVTGLVSASALAAGGDLGQLERQPTNWTAIGMFVAFVAASLWITKLAAARTRTAADFYTAGGGISGFQNGLAIAGDYMSAASFLGISAAVMANGYDGLIYSIGFLVGWPIITFLMAEKLRNLDHVAYIRYASEYYDFRTLEDFHKELAELAQRPMDVPNQARLFDERRGT